MRTAPTTAATLPYPPLHLARRVGALQGDDPHQYDQYEVIGRAGRNDLCAALPADWSWGGKRVLDLGCGAGRVLRHFQAEAALSEFYGCDIDAASIAWLREHLCPPFRCFTNREAPPLDLPSASLDLVYAISVFTHLTATWSAWLVEVHRVLQPGGLALLTFMGRGMWQLIAGEEPDEDEIGMVGLKLGQPWDFGGPMVLHSPWWIREHWGRGFDVLGMRPDGFAWEPGLGQGIVTLRKRDVPLTPEALERPSEDPRELASLRTSLRLLQDECRGVHGTLAAAAQRSRDAEARLADLERERQERRFLEDRVRWMESSRSWRLTAPLRALRRAMAQWYAGARA